MISTAIKQLLLSFKGKDTSWIEQVGLEKRVNQKKPKPTQ